MDPVTTRAARQAVACVPLAEALAYGRATWDGLLAHCPAASPFGGWAWHQAWLSSAPPEEVGTSHAVVLHGPTGDVEAVLPVGIRRMTLRRQPVTALTWAIGDVGCPDHLDVPALPGADLRALVPALAALPWDVMILGNLASDASNATRLAAAFTDSGHVVRRELAWPCPYVDLPATWEEYMASLSASRRQRLRRCQRTLQRDHAVTVTDYGPERLEEGWRRLLTLHEKRWAGHSAFGDPRIDGLHRCFGSELASRGQLWLATLDVDGEPAAAWYGFADRDTVYFYQSGRDPRREDQSVGVLMMMMMIRRAIERGYRRFDFLRGDEPYKELWTTARRITAELVIFRTGWRGLWLRNLDLAARWRARLMDGRRADQPRPRAARQ